MSPGPVCILVLGTHRSGTSVTAGLVQLQGFALGEPLLRVGDENPLGHFEHVRVLDLHEELLAEVGLRWSDAGDPLARADRARRKRWQAAIEERYLEVSGGAKRFAVKDPRLVHFLPLWRAALRHLGVRPLLLVTLRHPAATVRSLVVRNDMPAAEGERLWLHDMAQVRRHVGRHAHGIVRYEQLVTDPVTTMHGAFAAAGAPWDPTACDAMTAFVDPALDRSTRVAATGMAPTAAGRYERIVRCRSVRDWPRWPVEPHPLSEAGS